jgi:hypothetical protein
MTNQLGKDGPARLHPALWRVACSPPDFPLDTATAEDIVAAAFGRDLQFLQWVTGEHPRRNRTLVVSNVPATKVFMSSATSGILRAGTREISNT